jgi:hypothetical protein
VWQKMRTDAEIAAGYRAAVANRSGLNFYWPFDEAGAAPEYAVDASGNGRDGHVGHLSTTTDLMTYLTSNAMPSQPPRRPTRLPSTAPVVGDAPVVAVVVDSSNLVTLGSFDPEDDDLVTTITRAPAFGSLVDSAGATLTAGQVVLDATRRQSKRVWYVPSSFGGWVGDNFTYSVSDGGPDANASVVLERYAMPQPSNKTLTVNEDSATYIPMAQPYIASRSKNLTNLRVRITSLPARGTLYQIAPQDSTQGLYSLYSGSDASALAITAAGTVLTSWRGELSSGSRPYPQQVNVRRPPVVCSCSLRPVRRPLRHSGLAVFRPATNTFDASRYTSFRYQFVDPDDDSLVSDEASVHLRVESLNDVPEAVPLTNVLASGPIVIWLNGTDIDDFDADGNRKGTSPQFARVSTFPRIGRLFQANDTRAGALLDGTITHVATVVVSDVLSNLQGRGLARAVNLSASLRSFQWAIFGVCAGVGVRDIAVLFAVLALHGVRDVVGRRVNGLPAGHHSVNVHVSRHLMLGALWSTPYLGRWLVHT